MKTRYYVKTHKLLAKKANYKTVLYVDIYRHFNSICNRSLALEFRATGN